MKILIYILFVITTIYSQEINDEVLGLIDNGGNGKFIITTAGIKEVKDDVYLEYYKSIYEDSTITNPNMILNSKSVRIIPVIDPKDWTNLNYEIAPNVYFYDFIDYDSTGTIIIKPDISQYLKNYKSPVRAVR